MNALEIALRARDRYERSVPIDSTEAIDEARREAIANASIRSQARALLEWAQRTGNAEHPAAVTLRETTDPDALIDVLVDFYFELPASSGVRGEAV